MKSAIQKISARAKQLKKLHPNSAWKSLIKKASVEYRAGKLGATATKRPAYRQTGSSDKAADRKRTALAPGKRKSRSGVTYYERRKNRSDMPGKLTGFSNQGLKSELTKRIKDKLALALLRRDMALSKRVRKMWAEKVRGYKAELKRIS